MNDCLQVQNRVRVQYVFHRPVLTHLAIASEPREDRTPDAPVGYAAGGETLDSGIDRAFSVASNNAKGRRHAAP